MIQRVMFCDTSLRLGPIIGNWLLVIDPCHRLISQNIKFIANPISEGTN